MASYHGSKNVYVHTAKPQAHSYVCNNICLCKTFVTLF